jgi:hypothetical protein
MGRAHIGIPPKNKPCAQGGGRGEVLEPPFAAAKPIKRCDGITAPMPSDTSAAMPYSGRKAGALTFSVLFTMESLVRSLNAGVLSVQAYELLGSSRNVSIIMTMSFAWCAGDDTDVAFLLRRTRRRWTYTLGIALSMCAALFLASHTVARAGGRHLHAQRRCLGDERHAVALHSRSHSQVGLRQGGADAAVVLHLLLDFGAAWACGSIAQLRSLGCAGRGCWRGLIAAHIFLDHPAC